VTNGPVHPGRRDSILSIVASRGLTKGSQRAGWLTMLGTVLVLLPLLQGVGSLKLVSDTPAAVSEPSKDSSNSAALPSAPEPKIMTDGNDTPTLSAATSANTPVFSASSVMASAGTVAPRSAGEPAPLLKSPFKSTSETGRERKIWYGLMAVSHGAAVFDAWSTRRALSGNYGVEANPLMRPFAHSGAIYAATQVSPAFMDFLGRRMMLSHHGWIRKMWWVPQTAGTGVSLAAGAHNVGVVP
jgi:hypothetical protein